jgi:hypothetical protein
MWQNPVAATSVKDNLSAPRHLNQSFQQVVTATSGKDNLPAPRDLNQYFQQMATQQPIFFKICSMPTSTAFNPFRPPCTALTLINFMKSMTLACKQRALQMHISIVKNDESLTTCTVPSIVSTPTLVLPTRALPPDAPRL